MKLDKYIEEIIQDTLGCDAQTASDMWENSEIGEMVNDYIQDTIIEEYGEGMSFSSASGGVKLEFDVEGIVDVETDTYFDLEMNEVEF
jgi:hypothetical protein